MVFDICKKYSKYACNTQISNIGNSILVIRSINISMLFRIDCKAMLGLRSVYIYNLITDIYVWINHYECDKSNGIECIHVDTKVFGG